MTQMTIDDARARFAELLNRAEKHHERIVLTVNGEPAAVLLGFEDFESLIEARSVITDPETLARLQELADDSDTEDDTR